MCVREWLPSWVLKNAQEAAGGAGNRGLTRASASASAWARDTGTFRKLWATYGAPGGKQRRPERPRVQARSVTSRLRATEPRGGF